MASVNPYLNFPKKTEEAFNFYKSVFGGEFGMVMRFSDVPAEAMPPGAPAVDGNSIMHISLPIGNGGTVLMGSDTPDYMGVPTPGTNFSISVSADSREEADKIYNGLAEGGNATFPMGDAFWGSYFGMLKDKFGIDWMISHDPQRQQ